MKQGSLNKPLANSDDFHNDYSLRNIDTVKHRVVDYHYENQHRETRPSERESADVSFGTILVRPLSLSE